MVRSEPSFAVKFCAVRTSEKMLYKRPRSGILAVVLLIGYFYVKGHPYVVTNKRILVLRKFIGITVREVAHREVIDIESIRDL